MSDTSFACPSCEQRYAGRPVLVGRPVRCSGCKAPFRLHEDGSVELLPEPARHSSSETPAVPTDAAAECRRRRRESTDAIRQRLATSMQAAADAEAAKERRDRRATTGAHRRDASSERWASVGLERPVPIGIFLSGEGEAIGRRHRRILWIAIGMTALATAAAATVLLMPRDPARSMLRAYDRDFSGINSHPERHQALAARFWAEGERERYPGRIADGDLRHIPSADISAALEAVGQLLDGYRYLDELGAWVASDQVATARALVHDYIELPQERRLDGALVEAGVAIISPRRVRAELDSHGLGDPVVHALSLMLRDAGAPPLWMRGWTELQLAHFADARSADLRVLRDSYRIEGDGQVSGLLLRLGADGEWAPWQILVVRHDDVYARGLPPDPLLQAEVVARRRLDTLQQTLRERSAVDVDDETAVVREDGSGGETAAGR